MSQITDRLLWLSQATLAVDVETETSAARDYPEVLHSVKKFGLTALTPITDIALYSPELGILHLNMRGFNPYRKTMTEESRENWEFIKAVLCRPDVLIIGHNVLFDLRIIGVQYNAFFNQLHQTKNQKDWHIPLGAKVWCTEIIAKRMLLGEQISKKSGIQDKFDILSLSKRLDVDLGDSEAMVIWMKTQRAYLDGLVVTLSRLPAEEALWTHLGGHIPPNRTDLLQQAAQRLMIDYVGFDAKVAYQLYEKELEIAKKLAEGDVQIKHLKLLKYPELTQNDIRPEFKGHLDYWTRYMRLSANRSAYGLRVNKKYLRERKAEFKSLVKVNEELIMGSKDPNEPYPEFETYASQLVYVEMLLRKVNDSGSTYNQNIAQEWVFWKPVAINPALLVEMLDFPEGYDEADKEEWLNFLKPEPYTRFTDVKKAMPATQAPSFSLMNWIKRNCYHQFSEPLASLLAKTKADWLRTYYSTRRSHLKTLAHNYWKEHPLKAPEDIQDETFWLPLGKREFARRMSNNKKWIPYYVYCVAGAPLPSSEAFKYEAGLTTASLRRKLAAYIKYHGHEPKDYQVYVVENHLQQQSFSYGKAALTFFMEDPDYEESLKPMRDLNQYRAYVTRMTEIEHHAYLDGYVHSLIKPDAKTGRNTSVTPNLQNVAMKTKVKAYPTPYPGVFLAPTKMWFISIDYSNAEVRMGNMIAKDNVGASATEDSDFHSANAAIYWPELWAQADAKERRRLRDLSKGITFASAYGAGKGKVALMVRCSVDEAATILNNKKRAYWKTEEKKKEIEEGARKRMRAGYLPVFTSLWSKERIQMDRFQKDGFIDIIGYTAWNYIQQGGVTAMLRRADVLISEMLEREGYKTFAQQDIHDELLFAVDPSEYTGDLFPRILEMMNNIVPEEFLERTSPKTHFIAEVGPENAQKWGYHPTKEYPFPLSEFISQWGHFPLSEGETEAPTWVGPKHFGWTLETETALLNEKRKARAAFEAAGNPAASLKFGQEWLELQLALSQEQSAAVLQLLLPRELVWEDDDHKIQRSGILSFSSWMAANQVLYHRGKNCGYIEALREIRSALQGMNGTVSAWQEQYGQVFNLVSKEQ